MGEIVSQPYKIPTIISRESELTATTEDALAAMKMANIFLTCMIFFALLCVVYSSISSFVFAVISSFVRGKKSLDFCDFVIVFCWA